MGRKYAVLVLCGICFVVLSACGQGAETPSDLGTPENPVVMSFVLSTDSPEAQAGSERLRALLAQETGYTIHNEIAPDMSTVVEAMGRGQAHVGWLDAFAYLRAAQQHGVEVLLVASQFDALSYRSQIIAGAHTGIGKIGDLRGKSLCWGSPSSATGYIIPRLMLLGSGISPEADLRESRHMQRHSGVVMAVYRGECDAGATYVDARSSVATKEGFGDVMDKVVVVARSPKIPNLGVAVVEDMPSQMKKTLKRSLLDVVRTEEGRDALYAAFSVSGLQAKGDGFYDPLRALLKDAGVDAVEMGE